MPKVFGLLLVDKNGFPNIDKDYGPYNSTTEAENELGLGVAELPVGLTIGISFSDGTLKEFWVQNVNGSKSWVEKQTASNGGGISKEDADNLYQPKGSYLEKNALDDFFNKDEINQKLEDAGKIKSISVNNVPQDVDEKGNVNLIFENTPSSGDAKVVDGTIDPNDKVNAPSRKAVAEALSQKANSSELEDKVDKSTAINGHLLEDDVTITKEDIDLGNVENKSAKELAESKEFTNKYAPSNHQHYYEGEQTIKEKLLSIDKEFNGVNGEGGILNDCKDAYNQAIEAKNIADEAATNARNSVTEVEKMVRNAWLCPVCPEDQQEDGIPKDTYTSYTGVDGSVCKFFAGQQCQVEKTNEKGETEIIIYKVAFRYLDKSENKEKVTWMPVVASSGTETVIVDNIGNNQGINTPVDGSIVVGIYDSTGALLADTKKWIGQPISFTLDSGINYYVEAKCSDGILSNFSQPKTATTISGRAASGVVNVNLIFKGTHLIVNFVASDNIDNSYLTTQASTPTIYVDTQALIPTGNKVETYVPYDKYFTISGTMIEKQVVVDGSIVTIIYTANISKTVISNDSTINYTLYYNRKTDTTETNLGIGVVTINKEFISADDERFYKDGKIVDNTITELNKNNILGIYYKSLRVNVMIALPDGDEYTKATWSAKQLLVCKGKTYANNTAAINSDYYGEYNQYLIENAVDASGTKIDLSNFPAASACKFQSWKNGMIGAYLCAAGEANQITINKTYFYRILASLGFYRGSGSTSENIVAPTDVGIIWTSSELNDKNAVSTNSNYASKTNSLTVIPMRALSDFNL